MNENSPNLKVKCPTCRKESLYSKDNPFRPFCSERCRLIDLGQWASESFKIPISSLNPLDESDMELEDEKPIIAEDDEQ